MVLYDGDIHAYYESEYFFRFNLGIFHTIKNFNICSTSQTVVFRSGALHLWVKFLRIFSQINKEIFPWHFPIFRVLNIENWLSLELSSVFTLNRGLKRVGNKTHCTKICWVVSWLWQFNTCSVCMCMADKHK